MKVRFKAKDLEHYFITPLEEIKGKLPFQKEVIKQFKKKMQILLSIDSIDKLMLFKSLNFENLKGDRLGECSIRLNLQYRLIFSVETEINGDIVIDIAVINEISKHYER